MVFFMRRFQSTGRRGRKHKVSFFTALTILVLCYISLTQPIPQMVPVQFAPSIMEPLPMPRKQSTLDRYLVKPPKDVPYVALTFDDGPTEYTEALLDTLDQMEVQATFFLIGEQIEDYTHVVRRMDEAGHDIGNHTHRHAVLTSDVVADDMRQIRLCEQAIKDITKRCTLFIRPPYDALSEDITEALGAAGYRICLYDVDSRDFFTSSQRRILENLEDVKGGDIIRFHDGHIHPNTVKEIIRTLREKGLEPVSLRRLITANLS